MQRILGTKTESRDLPFHQASRQPRFSFPIAGSGMSDCTACRCAELCAFVCVSDIVVVRMGFYHQHLVQLLVRVCWKLFGVHDPI